MTVPLNPSEQARIDRCERLLEYRRVGQPVWDHELQEAKQHADFARQNAEARDRYQATLAAERQAKADQHAAVVQQRMEAEINTYKTSARAGFIGTDAQFEAAWPEILQQWQVKGSLEAMEAT